MKNLLQLANDGAADADFCTRLWTLLREAASLTVKYAGLALPDEVVVRLVTPEQFVEISAENFELVSTEAIDAFEPGSPDHAAMVARVTTERRRHRNQSTGGGLISKGAVVRRYFGGRELLILPEVWIRNRFSDRFGTTILGHELTHLAQSVLWEDMDSAFLRLNVPLARQAPRGKRLPLPTMVAVHHVREGHATWVQKAISLELSGVATAERLPEEPKYSVRFRFFKALFVGVGHGPVYEQGAAFVEAVHAAGGQQLIRRLLSDEDLLPTYAEVGAPGEWLERCAPEAISA
ncbi:hypothetical protein ACFVGM_09015 [Kitasatospora purpeofusca]|uniref:hypothetical protein n=1 Tax=Kitasatospora purpeofusca TaxID=67352 RepID=UPI003679515C